MGHVLVHRRYRAGEGSGVASVVIPGSCLVPHAGGCSVDNPLCEIAPNWIDAAFRHGDAPTWPYECGKFFAGMTGRNTLAVAIPDYGWNSIDRFEVSDRQDCEDLIALLERVKERLPDGK